MNKVQNATGRIEKATRGGHFGKAGLLVWTMQSVTAADGSQVPLRTVQQRLKGDSKAAKVATQMIITGALLPFIAPVALLHGFKAGQAHPSLPDKRSATPLWILRFQSGDFHE